MKTKRTTTSKPIKTRKKKQTSSEADGDQLLSILSGTVSVPPAADTGKPVKGRPKKEAKAWDVSRLEELAADPSLMSDKPLMRSMRVTASQAKAWLRSGARNRKIDGRDVARYAKQMINGTWDEFSPEALVFNKEGRLINGQHRLSAIIKASETMGPQFSVGFTLMLGFETEVQIYMDTGRGRTIPQVAFIRNLGITAAEVAITKALWVDPDPRKAKIPRVNDTQLVLDVAQQYKDGLKIASKKHNGRDSVAPAIIRAVMCRAYYFYCTPGEGQSQAECEENKERIERFIQVMDTGLPNGVDEHPPAMLRRAYLSRKITSKQSNKETNLGLYRKAIFAMKAYMELAEIKKLKESHHQEFPLAGFVGDEE